eukprot:6973436-Alexandrium_andersonii.AAC.1
MSASLVGSEMCIRDSISGRVEAGSGRGQAGPGAPAVYEIVIEVSGPAEAVSYTHLTLPTICSV